MTIDKALLTRFIQDYPFQPATALWRAVEIAHVTAYPFPEGFGLDLGCGDGKLTTIILERAGKCDLVGVDIDPKETEQAQQLGIYKRVHTTQGDCIPEENETFDFVFSNSVLEHIDNVENVIKEIARLLKPEGVFLFTVPGDEFHQCIKGPFFPFVSRQAYLNDLDVRVAHRRYWSVEDWNHHLFNHALEIEKVTKYFKDWQVQRWETISNFTAGILYNMFGKQKQPIEIQRTLGLRQADVKISETLASLLSSVVSFNLKENSGLTNEFNGCLMIQARKR